MKTTLTFEEFYSSVWYKVPEVWRSADDDNGKALQLLVYTMAQHMYYYFYNKIVNMDELFDPDLCPEKYLKFLSSLIGWNLVGTDPVCWREQIKTAPLLYKIKGTKAGLTLAEKLVGYSVFISELYRDHLGELTVKERIFNNIPDEILHKPWFKTYPRDDQGNPILVSIESDLFEAYNLSDAFLNDTGDVIRPYRNTGNKSVGISTLATTPGYDPLTGKGSLSRYSKTPRINVILKKDEALDSIDADGNVIATNLDAAMEMLLKFKPFHIFVNNVDVLFNLSDYVLGTASDNLAAECLEYREYFDFSVYLESDKTEESITFRNVTLPSVEQTVPWTPSNINHGTIFTSFNQYKLSGAKRVSDFTEIQNAGLSIKPSLKNSNFGYNVSNNHIWYSEDFSNPDGYLGTSVDIQTRLVKKDFLKYVPAFKFIKVDISDIFKTNSVIDLKSFFKFKYNLSKVQVDKVKSLKASQRDTVTINGHIESYLNNNPWELKNCLQFYPDSMIIKPSIKECLQKLIDEFIIVSLQYNNSTWLLLDNSCYKLYNQHIYIDSLRVSELIGNLSNDDFLKYFSIKILFAAKTKDVDDVPLEKTSRSMYINKRLNNKFTRAYSNVSSPISSEDIKGIQKFEFDSTTGTLKEDYINEKLYKKSLSNIYTRQSLKQHKITSDYTVVNKDSLNICDKHLWTVYSSLYTSYITGEKISPSWWSNYFQTTQGDENSNYLIPYLSVNTSDDIQETCRNSIRWQTALQLLDTTNPANFLATRKISADRENIWTRGTSKKLPYAYDGSSRRTLQGRRSEKVLFNRTDNMSDYATDITSRSQLSNLKYIYASSKADVSKAYFNTGFESSDIVIPTVENFYTTINRQDKVFISQSVETQWSLNDIDTRYDNATNYANRSTYYNAGTTDLLTSLYAGNMSIRMSPNMGLIYDGMDYFDFSIDGLITVTEIFNVSNRTQSTYYLKYKNPYFVWTEYGSGSYVNSGNYPLSASAIPNVMVTLNGIKMAYNETWTITTDVSKALKILTPIYETDIIEITYNVLNNDLNVLNPIIEENARYFSPVITAQNIVNIAKGILYRFPIPLDADISWIDPKTGEVVSSTTLTDLTSTINHDIVIPNILLTINGIEYAYGNSWKFIIGNNTSYIELLPDLGYRLTVADEIKIKYFIVA